MYMYLYFAGMEIVGTRWRVITAILGGVFWPLGNLILVGIAYAVPEWMKLQITLSIPGLLLLSYFWYVHNLVCNGIVFAVWGISESYH